ncbi:hypothetical protein BH09VER1_BH09VER1_47020 [soil metagenome]
MKTSAALDAALNQLFPLSAEELAEAMPRYRTTAPNQNFLAERERLERADDETLSTSAASAGSLKVGDSGVISKRAGAFP